MKIKKGDKVYIAKGKDRGKTGKVLRVIRDSEKVVVEGLNLHKKHIRPRRQGEKGQVVETPGSIHSSNVRIVAGDGKPAVRTGYKEEKGEKVRVCKKRGSVIA